MQVLPRAQQLTDQQVRDLAALEWRSRLNAPGLYLAAHNALAELGSAHQLEVASSQARLAAEGRGLGVEVATLATHAIRDAALEQVHAASLTPEHRSILRRAWRALLKAAGETP